MVSFESHCPDRTTTNRRVPYPYGHNVRTRTRTRARTRARRDRACPVHTPPQWVGYNTPTFHREWSDNTTPSPPRIVGYNTHVPPRIVGWNTHALPQWVSRHLLVTWWTGPGAALCKRSSNTTLYGNQPGVCTATQRCGRLPGSRHPAEIRTPDKSVFGPEKLGHLTVPRKRGIP